MKKATTKKIKFNCEQQHSKTTFFLFNFLRMRQCTSAKYTQLASNINASLQKEEDENSSILNAIHQYLFLC